MQAYKNLVVYMHTYTRLSIDFLFKISANFVLIGSPGRNVLVLTPDTVSCTIVVAFGSLK